MHALIVDGAVAQYPYTIGNLRRDNPSTSFPKQPTEELLAQWGMQPVTKVDRPSVDHTRNVNEGTPALVDGTWTQVWVVSDATSEEISERNVQAAAEARGKRAALLADTDWMALSDNTLTSEWTTYRQALRDITTHANWPHLNDDDWPTKP